MPTTPEERTEHERRKREEGDGKREKSKRSHSKRVVEREEQHQGNRNDSAVISPYFLHFRVSLQPNPTLRRLLHLLGEESLKPLRCHWMFDAHLQQQLHCICPRQFPRSAPTKPVPTHPSLASHLLQTVGTKKILKFNKKVFTSVSPNWMVEPELEIEMTRKLVPVLFAGAQRSGINTRWRHMFQVFLERRKEV